MKLQTLRPDASSASPRPTPQELELAFRNLEARNLPFVVVALVIFYSALTVVHLFLYSPAVGTRLAVIDALMALGLLGFTLYLRTHTLQPAQVLWGVGLIALAVTVSTLIG